MENLTIYCMNHSKHEIEFQFKGVPSLVAGMFFIHFCRKNDLKINFFIVFIIVRKYIFYKLSYCTVLLISFHILGSAATLISLLGMVFNVVTIAALLNHTPIRRHVTTPFVISLAFSDLLFSITVLPVMAVRFFTEYDPPYYFFLLQ